MNLTSPLKNIAISFSGGGYRAAAYNLGVLSYLYQIQSENEPLLKQVVMISTISGGTITGVKYALCLAQGKSFDTFYSEMYDFLQKDFIMDEAFNVLNTPNNWLYKTKSKNLINAFAEIYQQKLFDKSNFGQIMAYSDKTGVEFMFNATDLENAKPFRFQTRGRIGNFEHNISHNLARNIRLGDITAASSCFPGGFEPLIFPDDFIEPTDSIDTSILSKKRFIMDGGIVDNQGIESIWLAEDRKAKGDDYYIGTYIISDVALKNPTAEEDIVPTKGLLYHLGEISLKTYYNLTFIIFLLSIAIILFVANKWWVFLGTIFFTISTILVLVYNLSISGVRNKLKKLLNQKTPKLLDDFSIIRKISLNLFFKLLDVRLNSMMQLNQTVFLDRLRQLHYDATYDNNKWNKRTVANLIYELPKIQSELSINLNERINSANRMDTTLWFSDEEKMNDQKLHDLIICGQATICYNLKTYLENRLKDTKNPIKPELVPNINNVLIQLTEDLKQFNDNPQWLLSKHI